MLPDSLRKRVIAEWRGLPEPATRVEHCRSVADVLKVLMPKWGLDERLTEQQITDAWHSIVGGFIAQHSTPASLANGCLTIQVLQPSVRYELDRSWKPEILKKLHERFGPKAVREVRFRL